MSCRAIVLTILFGCAACSATPASFGITGPGTSAPASFTTPPPDPNTTVNLPGLPTSDQTPFSNSITPAGDAAKAGNFYGYN
jgi:hypothetical protein